MNWYCLQYFDVHSNYVETSISSHWEGKEGERERERERGENVVIDLEKPGMVKENLFKIPIKKSMHSYQGC